MEDYTFFAALVVGDNPSEIMDKYNAKKLVDKYVVYKYADAGKIKKNCIKMYREIINNPNTTMADRIDAESFLEDIMDKSDNDFFTDFTEDYEHDKETGDAISNINPNGKYSYCKVGKFYSLPFIKKDGTQVYSGKKGDFAWEIIHNHGQDIYSAAWDMVMGDKKPENEQEETIYENMKNRTEYFKKFGTKECYVASNTAFWCYAYVDKNGWIDMGGKDQFEWMNNFYDRFIKDLPDNETLTIYECRK